MIEQRLAPLDHWLWSRAGSGEERRAALQVFGEAARETTSPVTVWTVIAETARELNGPLDRLQRLAGSSVLDARWLGEMRVFLLSGDGDPFVVAAAPTLHEGVIHLLASVPVSDNRWKRTARLVARSAPLLAPILLDETELLGLGDALEEHGPVTVTRLTARDRSGASLSRSWPPHHRARPSHREALAEARGASVKTMMLHVGGRMLLHLRRDAGATLHGGEFALFEAVVLRGLAQAVAKRRQLFSSRERRVDAPPPRPIAVRMDGSVFAAPEAVAELLDALLRQRETAVAVFHRNPYMHAAVTDYTDGSNFDVFVTDEDEVVIIPGYRASVGSLARLTDTIGERFAAREVAELAEQPPATLEELLAKG